MRQIQKGSANRSVDIYIIDSTDGTPELGVLFNTTGMDLEYRREGSGVVNVTEVTLAALTTTHTDGGFLEIGHGWYRFDLPDAAFATGSNTVSIQGTVTGMIVLPQTVQLVDFDPEDSVRLGLTSLPNAAADAAGGLPVSDAGGLNMDAIITDIANVDSKVSNIGAGGTGAVNHEMVADNTGAAIKGVSFVGVQTGTFVNTESNPVTYHEINDTGNNIDIVYRTTVGGAHQAVDILFQGYLNGGNDECIVQLYDFVGATWDAVYTIGGQSGSSNIVEPAIRALAKHTGTGADLGDVLVRFTCTAQSNPTLFVAVLLASAVSTSASVGYSLGSLWFDDSASNTGTTAFVDGVADNPVSTWAAIVSLVGSVGLKKVHVAAGSTVTLTGNTDEYYLFGANWSLNLNGQSIEGAAFDGASSVVGVGTATVTAPVFHECQFGNCTVPPSSQIDCGYAGLLTLGSAGNLFIVKGHSEVGGSSAPSVDMNGLGASSTLNVRSWSGGISVIGITISVVASLEIENGGTVDVNGTGGSVFVRGRVSAVVDSSAGAVTIDQSVVVNNASIRTEMDSNSTKLAEITPARLAELDPANMPADLDTLKTGVTVSSIGTSVITADAIAADAIGALELAADAVDEIRDSILTDSISFNGADVASIKAVTDMFVFTVANIVDANISAINSVTASATKLERSASTIVIGAIDTAAFTPTTTQFEADNITEATAGHYNGRIVIFTSGPLTGQATDITDYALTGSRGHFTVTAMTEAAGDNNAFVIV